MQMETFIMDNGLTIRVMDMQSKLTKVEIPTKAILKIIRSMDMVFTIGKMAKNMKVGGTTVKNTALAFSMIMKTTFNTPSGNMERTLVPMMKMESQALRDLKLSTLMTLKIHKARNY